jgi:hypothetical protein
MCIFTKECNVFYVYKTYIFPNNGQNFLKPHNSYQKKNREKITKKNNNKNIKFYTCNIHSERCMVCPWVTHLKMGNPWVPIWYIANISSQIKYSVLRCISGESFIISTFIPINSIVTLETFL